jgi:chemosensory pili system protein ChpA (sensor histidine kinase/response regulator)
MSGYQIDEVRELFTSDMNRFMSDLEVRAGELRDELAIIRQRAQVVDQAQNALAVSFHAIAGTSALLSVASSQTVAGYLENMVRSIDASVRAILVEGDRLDHYHQACDLGITALRTIIADELKGNRPAADRCAGDALERLKRAANPPALAVVTAEGSAIRGAASASSAQLIDDERAELLSVFRDELRTAMSDAKAQLEELELGPDRGAALSRLGSVLHMMKGSAASVGESTLAIELRSIYDTVEDFLERGEVPDAAAARRIRSELLACEPAPVAKPSAIDGGWDEPEGNDQAAVAPEVLFGIEASDLLRQASSRFADLGRDPVAAREDLGRIFHRIKGSAYVVGLPEVGGFAAQLEQAARQHEALELTQLDRLAALIAKAPSAVDEPEPHATRPKTSREPVPDVVTGELWESFVEESAELLETIERGARELETAANLNNVITSLLGAFHTLKGAANTVGLPPVGRELHVVETMLESLRSAPSAKRRSFVLTRLFEVLERLRRNLRLAPRGEVECAAEALEQDVARMANLEAHSIETPSGHSWLSAHDAAWSERHRSAAPPVVAGSSREHSSDLHSEGHRTGSGSAGTGKAGGERRFIRVPAERLDALMDMVGELIVTRSRVNAGLSSLSQLHQQQEQRRQRLVEIVETFTEQAEYTNLGGVARRQRRGGVGPTAIAEFGALEFDVYEEVHVLSRRLAEASSDVNDTSLEISNGMAQLSESTEELGGIVSTLQTQINRARMVPLEALFSRLALPVRDAAERERKLVDVTFEGAEVVIDKAIADALYAPMLHLVRNSVAHGIEASGRRRSLGKPERGKVALTARQEAGEIVIGVSDDGAGIDVEALHRQGVARGLISADTPVHSPEVLELVFSAGLSTSASTNDLAGRGMGGDVVRRAVQRLGGSVRVANEPGRGATFLLRLPVTLAITRAIIIRQGERLFGIPLLFVERIVGRDDLQHISSGEQRTIRHGEDLLSVFRIVPGENSGSVFLICSVGGRRLAVEADSVVEHDEVVVKPLGQLLDGHPLFAGASQRGDGELALILDMQGVAESHTAVARPAPARATPVAAGRALVAPGDVVEPIPVRAQPQAEPRAQIRVLFVDDSLSVRKVAENTLRKLGVSVITASDGRDALDRLRDEPVSIVFTDLEMPRMHGYELIQEMRYIPAYRRIPIVVVSSRSGDKHVQKALEAGANEYLTKPFSAEALSGALQKLLPSFRGEGT